MPNRETVDALLVASDVLLDRDELDEVAEAYPALLELEKTFQILLDRKLGPDSLFQTASDGCLDE